MMLLRLLRHEAAQPFRHEVLALVRGGALEAPFREAAAAIHSLGMRRGLPTPAAALRLRRTVRRVAPDLLVGWLYHGNLAASFAARGFGRRPPVVWNIRHSPDDLSAERWLTARLIRWGAGASRRVRAVVYNSATSARLHRRLGYAGEGSEVLPNGFDVERFSPSAAARGALRERLGIGEEALVVGRIGRYPGMKGFELFLEAAAALDLGAQGVHLLLAGRGVDASNPSLTSAIEAHGLGARCHLLGPQDGLEDLLPGLDLLCSSSLYGEGFPNIVAEAMACGVPCVVTAVGDSAFLVGDEGVVVAPGEVAPLKEALGRILEMPADLRREMGRAGRRRIVEHFSSGEVFPRYVEIWRRALAGEGS